MTALPATEIGADLMTATEVAAMLRMKRDSVHNMARRGMIPSYQIGHRRLFKRPDVHALIESRRRPAGSMQDRQLAPLTGNARKEGTP